MVPVSTATLERPSTNRAHRTPSPGRSLAERYPAIAAEWDTAANSPLLPSDVTSGTDIVVVFRCLTGHGSYLMRVDTRTCYGRGCPECSRLLNIAAKQQPKAGKTLADAFPEVAATWDFEANYPLTPSDVAPRSNRKAFFLCPVGHGSHESFISNRTAGNGCPDCGAARKVAVLRRNMLRTRGSLADARPDLVPSWSTRNSLRPDEVTVGTDQLIWWDCEAGHETYLSPVGRRSTGKGCPECGGIKRNAAIAYAGPKPGESLAELRPDLVAEWDPAKNTGTPADVGTKSDRVGFWTCSKTGRSYEHKIRSRCNAKECPCCRTERLAARKAGRKP